MDRICSSRTGVLAAALFAGAACTPGSAFAATPDNVDEPVTTVRDMFEQGEVDGELGLLYYANRNAFFSAPDEAHHTAAVGGELGFTTAPLHGFSLRLSAFAQSNFVRSESGYNRDLGKDIAALGEAWIQWQGYDLRLRAGNQKLHAPFTSTYDYRIIPQVYQGVSARYGDDNQHITVLRMYRYKSRIGDSYDRTTNYNVTFSPFGPNTTEETDGFWALGGVDTAKTDALALSGQAWFFNYKDYANMYYLEGRVAAAGGTVEPFLGLQFIRETEDGRALLGNVDSHVYGVQLGLNHRSLTATLNYNHIPHENGSYLNGSLVTPYAHNVSSGPLFAQPFLTSTQDLGSGDAYSVAIKGSPFDNVFAGARYSFMDLTPRADGESIEQSGYLIYAIYDFSGALAGLSVANFFAYQTREREEEPYWENRFAIQYEF